MGTELGVQQELNSHLVFEQDHIRLFPLRLYPLLDGEGAGRHGAGGDCDHIRAVESEHCPLRTIRSCCVFPLRHGIFVTPLPPAFRAAELRRNRPAGGGNQHAVYRLVEIVADGENIGIRDRHGDHSGPFQAGDALLPQRPVFIEVRTGHDHRQPGFAVEAFRAVQRRIAESEPAGDIGHPYHIHIFRRAPPLQRHGPLPYRLMQVVDLQFRDGPAVAEQFGFSGEHPAFQHDFSDGPAVRSRFDPQLRFRAGHVVLTQPEGAHAFGAAGTADDRMQLLVLRFFAVADHGGLYAHHLPVFHLLVTEPERFDGQLFRIQLNRRELLQQPAVRGKQPYQRRSRGRGVAEIHHFKRQVVAEDRFVVVGVDDLRRSLRGRFAAPFGDVFPVDPQQVVAVDHGGFELGAFNVVVPGGQADPVDVVRDGGLPVMTQRAAVQEGAVVGGTLADIADCDAAGENPVGTVRLQGGASVGEALFHLIRSEAVAAEIVEPLETAQRIREFVRLAPH